MANEIHTAVAPKNLLTDYRTRSRARRSVRVGFGLALLGAALVARRYGVTPPAIWFALGGIWFAMRWVAFHIARPVSAPVVTWRHDEDAARPEQNIAWPTVSVSTGETTAAHVAAPFGFYVYEFGSNELPDALPVRVLTTPLGPVLMHDDHAHASTGPAIFMAAMLVLWVLWGPVQQILSTPQ